MTVTIKGVDMEIWKKFKADAAIHGQSIAEHFTNVVNQHCVSLSWEDAFKSAQQLRQKSGKWQGSEEIRKWRAKRVL
ncbi:MAG TPA: hypothetical protein VJH88_05710 [Candidatus Nanoarchaeia archaeon]|nr:hypothetical protein [Candidatus Nanoarchaeia archaeon]